MQYRFYFNTKKYIVLKSIIFMVLKLLDVEKIKTILHS